jgi:hypothetical protein
MIYINLNHEIVKEVLYYMKAIATPERERVSANINIKQQSEVIN